MRRCRPAPQAAHSMDGVKPGRTYADFANAAASGGGIIIIAFLLVFPSRICAHNDLDGGAHYAIDPATGLPRYAEI
ncbi:unnamed protein product [Tilletia controversa]|nr:hypothetical protein CF328_g1003 [Tilletia controversa]CAD6925162.1 unnamed protein product [Tilletia controversa]